MLLADMHREEMPRFVPPMLASKGGPRTDDGWAMEVKWDGCRAQFATDGSSWWLRTRHGRECSEEFPELESLADELHERVVLDGELICVDGDGKPDFSALRKRLSRPTRTGSPRGGTSPVTLMAFDVLHLTGSSTRSLPYRRRRELLAELNLVGPHCQTPRHFIGEGDALLRATAEHGLEGIVCKRLDAPYTPGRRTSAWLKHKHRRRERFVVTGWREHDDGLPEFLLARRHDGNLIPAGSASLGLDTTRRAELLNALAEHKLPTMRRRRSVRWALPVVEVSADVHGPPNGTVRDAVLRELFIPGALPRPGA